MNKNLEIFVENFINGLAQGLGWATVILIALFALWLVGVTVL